MKMMLMIITLLFLFSGCSNKQIVTVTQKELICLDLEHMDIETDEVDIRIHPADVGVFEAKKEEYKSVIRYLNKQIDNYYNFCKKELK